MKKYIFTACLFVFSAAFAFNFDVPKPSAEIKKFDVDSIGLRDITFVFDVAVKNPYPVGITLAGVKMKYSIEGKQFFETETSKGFKVKAKGTAVSQFKVNLKYADIINIVKDYSKRDYLDTVIDTEIVVPLPDLPQLAALPKTLSFKYALKKKIPAIKPKVAINGFRVAMPTLKEVTDALKKSAQNVDPNDAFNMFTDILSGKKAKNVIDPASIDLKINVDFDIELKNETKGRLDFRDLNYTLFVNGSELVKGITSKIAQRGDTQVLTVSNVFSSKSLAGPVMDAFKARKGAFRVIGGTKIKLPDEIKKEPIPLSFSEDGSFLMK